MKRLALVIWLLCATSLFAEDIQRAHTFIATGADDAVVTLKGTGVYNHRLTWTGAGTRTTCSIKLQQSEDAVTWTDLIAAQNCATDGSSTTTGYANFTRINVTVLTGSGNTVHGRYDGTPFSLTEVDPCSYMEATSYPINTTASLTLVTGVTGKKVYICSIAFNPSVAQNIAIIEGTGTVCASGTVAGIIGGATAATGFNLAANQGIAWGNGKGTVAQSANITQNVCMLLSGSAQVSGHMRAVIK